MQLTVPLNVTLQVWNQKQKQPSAEFLRDLLHDVCDKAAGKCTNSTGKPNTDASEVSFFLFLALFGATEMPSEGSRARAAPN